MKLCRGGSPDIRPVARGLTSASHVTQAAKGMTNAGRSPGAGVVPGARLWSDGCPNRDLVMRGDRSASGADGLLRGTSIPVKSWSLGVWPE